MLELIVPVEDSRSASYWKFDNIRFSIPVGSHKDTYQQYSVRAVHEWNKPAFDNISILNVLSFYPIKWCFTDKLIDYNDTSLMVKKFEKLSGLFYSVVYNINNFDCLKAVPPGSGVMVKKPDIINLHKLKDYKVWIDSVGSYRKQWVTFCEYITRGIIPVGVIIDNGYEIFRRNTVVRRDLHYEKTERPPEWAITTSVQNIVSYWEVIQSQMDRLSRAKIQGQELKSYGLFGEDKDLVVEETV